MGVQGTEKDNRCTSNIKIPRWDFSDNCGLNMYITCIMQSSTTSGQTCTTSSTSSTCSHLQAPSFRRFPPGSSIRGIIS